MLVQKQIFDDESDPEKKKKYKVVLQKILCDSVIKQVTQMTLYKDVQRKLM